ncbi:MAG: hypothetical protein QXI84_05145 [Thermofilaceae archaeon]
MLCSRSDWPASGTSQTSHGKRYWGREGSRYKNRSGTGGMVEAVEVLREVLVTAGLLASYRPLE